MQTLPSFHFSLFIKKIKKQALKECKNYGLQDNKFVDFRLELEKKIISLLNENKSAVDINHIENLVQKLKKIELLDFHYSIAKRQRERFNYLKHNVPEDSIFIVFDFKEKVKIGLSPEQMSQEFYNLKSRFVLGFGIYYWENNKLEKLNVDLISDNMGQKAVSFIYAFKFENFYI